jgi:membrane associated rhomboid family serine protease
VDHGYVVDGRLVPCSREQLLRIVETGGVGHVQAVWTPEHPRPVPPAEVPWLFDAFRRRTARSLRAETTSSLLQAAMFAALGFYLRGQGDDLDSRILFLLAGVWGILPAIRAAFGVWRLRRARPEWMTQTLDRARTAMRLFAVRPLATYALLGSFVLAFLAQGHVGMERSVIAAGLLHDAVRAGEAWRLLTASFLHGNWVHLLMNGYALWALGPLVESLSSRWTLPVVHLIAVLAGMAASLLVTPDGPPSVGASGGLMGLLGFLAVLSWRRRAGLPRGFASAMLTSIALMAVLGFVLREYVDNAAHAGGLVAGVVVALLAVRRGPDLPARPPRWMAVAGALCAGILVAGWGYTLWRLLAPAT